MIIILKPFVKFFEVWWDAFEQACNNEGYGSGMKAFSLNQKRQRDRIRSIVTENVHFEGGYVKPGFFVGKGKDGKTYKVGIWE